MTMPKVAATIEPVAELRGAFRERLGKFREHYSAIRSVQT
jgi:hypothetical protein